MELLETIQASAIIGAAKAFLISNWTLVLGAIAAFLAIKLLKVGIKVALYILIVSLTLRILPEITQLF